MPRYRITTITPSIRTEAVRDEPGTTEEVTREIGTSLARLFVARTHYTDNSGVVIPGNAIECVTVELVPMDTPLSLFVTVENL